MIRFPRRGWRYFNVSPSAKALKKEREKLHEMANHRPYAFLVWKAVRPVRISQWRNMAVKSRAAFSVESCSTVNFILRDQLGYCQVVPGRFCWATSLVRSS